MAFYEDRWIPLKSKLFRTVSHGARITNKGGTRSVNGKSIVQDAQNASIVHQKLWIFNTRRKRMNYHA
jgi:hypothetical protein